MSHLSYSQDIVLSDQHLFRSLHTYLKGKDINSVSEVKTMLGEEYFYHRQVNLSGWVLQLFQLDGRTL